MDKLLSALINSGFQIKNTSQSQDGLMLVFKQDGKDYRLFCAEKKPVPKKIEQSVSSYID